jgi:hypothetical protein
VPLAVVALGSWFWFAENGFLEVGWAR